MMLATVFTTFLLAASSVAAIPVSPDESGLDDSRILDESAWAINDTVPSVEEFQAMDDELEEGRLMRRQDSAPWVGDNFFRFYLRTMTWTSCPRPGACGSTHDYQILRRDACNWDRCDNGRNLPARFSPEEGLCNKGFSACRLAQNARWNLMMRQTPDSGSCQNMASVWFGSGPRLRTYASLHDDANGRHIGWCWYERSHKFSEFCGGLPYSVDSLIKCGWM